MKEPKFGQEQTYHAENERKVDDGGNFLQQIRTKVSIFFDNEFDIVTLLLNCPCVINK